jgi:hypothetical protein
LACKYVAGSNHEEHENLEGHENLLKEFVTFAPIRDLRGKDWKRRLGNWMRFKLASRNSIAGAPCRTETCRSGSDPGARSVNEMHLARDRENPWSSSPHGCDVTRSGRSLGGSYRISGVPVECLELVSSSSQAHGTSFRTEREASVWRSSRCSMAASAGQSACKRGASVITMTLKARVKAGWLVVDEPTDLPEGTEIELLPLGSRRLARRGRPCRLAQGLEGF